MRLDIYEKYKLRESIPSQKKRSNTAKPTNEEETTQNSEWIIYVICGLVKNTKGSPGLTNQQIPDFILETVLEAALLKSGLIL